MKSGKRERRHMSRAGGGVVPFRHRVYVVLREKLGDGRFPVVKGVTSKGSVKGVSHVKGVSPLFYNSGGWISHV